MRGEGGGKLGKELGLLGCVNEVVAAVAASWGAMSDGARVEAAPRLAQWRVDVLPCYTYRKSEPFRIGLWNWFDSLCIHSSLEKKLLQ